MRGGYVETLHSASHGFWFVVRIPELLGSNPPPPRTHIANTALGVPSLLLLNSAVGYCRFLSDPYSSSLPVVVPLIAIHLVYSPPWPTFPVLPAAQTIRRPVTAS
jgi:hypothetical protein